MELADYLQWLVDAGLGTMPGTAAEILDDEIRDILSPNKLKTRPLGRDHQGRPRDRPALDLDADVRPHRESRTTSPATSTLLREIQKETGGFTEFVPLGFIHERNMLYNLMGSAARARRWMKTCA